VFHGQRGQVGVGDKVRNSLPIPEELLEDRPMTLGRAYEPRAWLVHPTLNAGESLIEREGVLKHTRVGADANECS